MWELVGHRVPQTNLPIISTPAIRALSGLAAHDHAQPEWPPASTAVQAPLSASHTLQLLSYLLVITAGHKVFTQSAPFGGRAQPDACSHTLMPMQLHGTRPCGAHRPVRDRALTTALGCIRPVGLHDTLLTDVTNPCVIDGMHWLLIGAQPAAEPPPSLPSSSTGSETLAARVVLHTSQTWAPSQNPTASMWVLSPAGNASPLPRHASNESAQSTQSTATAS